ncbi:FHA domain-containing protein [Fimbriiglobus ruber]|uniref:FHA domain-containing protein n=1 Tax=Fimbriiglobus ruber TaxID=1908690 RepID=A0A225DRI5_9BACT|nr:FHA domain-containing protein [Fimbriiglobus ruber]OWK38727.1 hypothetical protein FRUB_07847 [Fimbriiglobus ruber]
MKIQLVVAAGVHKGKAIDVPGAQFVIGRDEGCHLRPASPLISNKHCVVFVRDGKAFAKDMGSTNGTFVNDERIEGECEIKQGDRLRLGPLEFTIALSPGGPSDSTPLPDALKAVKSGSSAAQKPVAPPKPNVTAIPKPTAHSTGSSANHVSLDGATAEKKPAAPSKPPTQKSAGPKPEPVKAPTPVSPLPPPAPVPTAHNDGDDHAAAMLLGMGDEDPPGSEPQVPEGSTVMELPSVDAAKLAAAAKEAEAKKKIAAPDASGAARDALSRYARRPNTNK